MVSRVAKRFQRNWRYGYIIPDIRGTNLQVLMIIPHPTPLWLFRMLPTEVLCDCILVIFNECSNEPYITSISEAEYLWRLAVHLARFGKSL